MPLTPAATADTRYHLHAYTQPRQLEREGPLVITRGDGVYVIDEHGQRYLEGMAGLWCAALGFSEPRLVQAATRQLQTLPYYHTFSGKVPGPVTELAEALIRWAPVPMARVLFANSGSESNDTAFKLVRYYNNAHRPAREEEDHRSRQGLPRRHGRGRVAVGAADDASALRPADRRRGARRLPARLPVRARRRDRPSSSRRGWRDELEADDLARGRRTRWPPSSPSRCRARAA